MGRSIEEAQLDGDFSGFEDTNRVFRFLSSGNTWRQRHYYHHYHYAYMPRAKVVERGGTHYLEVEGVGVSIEVERVW